MIYILTGDIRSGKTTALFNWVKQKKDVDGLLCPDDKDGKRYFLKVKSGETFPLEATNNEKAIISVGPFRFLKSGFEKANVFLSTMLLVPAKMYLIIDELGKLELKDQGLHLSAKLLIPKFINNANQHLIIVVRASLLNDIVKHYDIFKYKIITTKDLTENSLT